MALDYCEAKRFIDGLPWPEGTRPLVTFGFTRDPQGGTGHCARLYRPEKRFREPVEVGGPTREGCLRIAPGWIEALGLPPELGATLGRLKN